MSFPQNTRAFAPHKLVRRGIIEELRQANAHIWGKRLAGDELLAAAAAKVLEELAEVFLITGKPPRVSNIMPVNVAPLLVEMADVEEALLLIESEVLKQPVPSHTTVQAISWSKLPQRWAQIQKAPSLALQLLPSAVADTRMGLYLLLELMRVNRASLWRNGQAPYTPENLKEAVHAKRRSKGLLVPFLLESVALPATSHWCGVFAQKIEEVDPAGLNLATRVAPHHLAA